MRIMDKPSNRNVLYSADPFTGSSVVIKMPGGDGYGDEVSSMNTSHRGDPEINEIKIVGRNPNSEYSVTDHSSPATSENLEIVQDHKSRRCLSLWRCICIPRWIRRAPYWLRVTFIGSLALLIAAAVLLGLGVGLSDQDSSKASQNVQSPTSQNNPTSDFWGTVDTSTSGPETPSLPQTEVPTVATFPVLQTNQTDPLTDTQDPEVFTFYVAGGRYSDDERALVPERLENLPNNMGTSFLLHIGDWNSPSGGCEEQSYQDANTLFSTSPVPVYMVPGDNEYNGKLNKPQ
jgi:hypothetical protein